MKLLYLKSACRIMMAFFAYILVFAAVLPLSAIVLSLFCPCRCLPLSYHYSVLAVVCHCLIIILSLPRSSSCFGAASLAEPVCSMSSLAHDLATTVSYSGLLWPLRQSQRFSWDSHLICAGVGGSGFSPQPGTSSHLAHQGVKLPGHLSWKKVSNSQPIFLKKNRYPKINIPKKNTSFQANSHSWEMTKFPGQHF
jgi:hypothetical protein